MKITLWGVRGSLASPMGSREYRSKLAKILSLADGEDLGSDEKIGSFIKGLRPELKHVVGGNTTCISVESDSGEIYIVDAGTGIRNLGNELVNGPCGQGEGRLNVCFTHTHWDHIQGLPFFRPMYIPGNEINFLSPYENLEDRLIEQQEKTYFFPVRFEETASKKTFTSLKNGVAHEDGKGMSIEIYPLRHPGGCFAYSFKENGKKFLFVTDGEFYGEDMEGDEYRVPFFRDADLCLIDAQYTLNDAFYKFYWGHTSVSMAVNCGIHWKVKNLILTHHEPTYSDSQLMDNYREALQHRKDTGHESPRIVLGREGMKFKL